jgi:hypothetical protein
MKKIRRFKCHDCGTIERMVVDGVTIIKCECGKEAKMQLSAPKHFGNTTGRSPSAR